VLNLSSPNNVLQRTPVRGVRVPNALHYSLLVRGLPFEVLDALAGLVLLLLEMIVGAADESVGFSELLSDVGLVLGVPAFDEDREALGHKLNLVAEAFDQHAGMALDLFKAFFHPRGHFFEASVNCSETLINCCKAIIQQRLEPLLLSVKALFEVLNKFLIHSASAVSKG